MASAFPYLATALSAVVAYGLGALWYSPALFAKPWVEANKLDPAKLQMTATDGALTFGAWLLAATGFSALVAYAGDPGLGVLLGLAVSGWLAFALPSEITRCVFNGRAWILLPIEGGYTLVAMLLMAVIHAVL